MRRNFQEAMKLVFKWEGGYSDTPGDNGGPTNFGITQKTLALYRKAPVTSDDVKALSRAEVERIYELYYWNAIKADQLPDGVDLIAFDIAVNMGPRRSTTWLTETQTLEPVSRIGELHKRRLSFWQHLASYARFGRGWVNRETEIEATALRLAKFPPPSTPTFTSKASTPDPVEQFRVELQKLFPVQSTTQKDNAMIAPKISLSYVVSIISSLVGLGHITGIVNIAPNMGLLPGLGLLLAAGVLASLKRSKLREMEEQQLARLTNQKIADLLLEGQDQLSSVIQNRLNLPDGSKTMNTAEALIEGLTKAYQQYPGSHIEAALSAAKAVSSAVRQINDNERPLAAEGTTALPVAQQTPIDAAAVMPPAA